MVMGPTHAMSGAAAGLLAAQLLPPNWGGPTSPTETFIWAGVCAGASLLPDLDLPGSTVSRSFGPASTAASHAINAMSTLFYQATSSGRDNHRDGGHRTLTHTLAFALALGVAVSAAVTAFGKPAILATFFFTLGLALRGLAGSWAKENGAIAVVAASAVLAAVAGFFLPAETSSVSLGAMVTVGCITHCLGDGITKEGIPFLAPFVTINGKRWWEFTLPSLIRIRANGTFEKVVLLPALTVFTLALAFAQVGALVMPGRS